MSAADAIISGGSLVTRYEGAIAMTQADGGSEPVPETPPPPPPPVTVTTGEWHDPWSEQGVRGSVEPETERLQPLQGVVRPPERR